MRLKNDALSNSLRMLAAKSTHTAAYLANKACMSIAIKAVQTMPRVMPAKMDEELNAAIATDLIRVKSGKRFSRSKKNRGYAFGPVGKGAYPSVPLLALIINAQANPASNFNRITGGVFARDHSPFKGLSREAGREAMRMTMRRVLAARHSSSGFFKACAGVVRFIFSSAVRNVPVTGIPTEGIDAEAVPGTGNISGNINRLAGGTVATGVSDQARATFWVATTEPDTKGVPGGALYRIAQPVWQAAVDAEAVSIKTHAMDLFSRSAAESGLKVR
jgi:hypothetical protein